MNAFITIFFITLYLNDFIFKSGFLLKSTLYLTLAYTIVYMFTSSSKYHTYFNKMLMATFSQSYDPTIYAKCKFPMENAKLFIEEYAKKNDNMKITPTLLFTKILSKAIEKYRDFNNTIKCGKLVDRGTIDLSLLIDVDGKNLAKKLLTDANNKSLKELSTELSASAKTIRKGDDKDFNKQVNLLGSMPSFLVAFVAEFIGFLANLGITFKPLGVEKNQFGTMMITSVGGKLKIEDGYAPLIDFIYVTGVVTICYSIKKEILQKDGSIKVEEFLPVSFSMDHRYLDGVSGAKILKYVSLLLI